jgi:hypothetical protein
VAPALFLGHGGGRRRTGGIALFARPVPLRPACRRAGVRRPGPARSAGLRPRPPGACARPGTDLGGLARSSLPATCGRPLLRRGRRPDGSPGARRLRPGPCGDPGRPPLGDAGEGGQPPCRRSARSGGLARLVARGAVRAAVLGGRS